MRHLPFFFALLLCSTAASAQSPEPDCRAALPPGNSTLPANTPALPILDVGRAGTLVAQPTLLSSAGTTELATVRFSSAFRVADQVAFAGLPVTVAGASYTTRVRFECGAGTADETTMSWTAGEAAPLPSRTGTLAQTAASSPSEPQVELTASPELVPFLPAAVLVWRVEGISSYPDQDHTDLRVDLGPSSLLGPAGGFDGIAYAACSGEERGAPQRTVTTSVHGWLSNDHELEPATLEVDVDCTSQWEVLDRNDDTVGCSAAGSTSLSGAWVAAAFGVWLLRRRRSAS